MWWLVGCAVHARSGWVARPEAATWRLVSLTAVDDATLEEHRTLRATPAREGGFVVETTRTAVTTDGPDGHHAFDSEAPDRADPWPFALQHAVATAPARVVEAAGVLSLADPATWKDAAMDALLGSALPPAAIGAGRPLVEPAAFEADLRRWFPGLPTDGALARQERFAGVDADRREVCVETRTGTESRWRCDGEAADAAGRLRELSTWTEIVLDRSGLRSVEQGYAGLLAAEPGAGRALVPIAGRRLAERVEER